MSTDLESLSRADELSIVDALRAPMATYTSVAHLHGVERRLVSAVAQKHDLTRKRGVPAGTRRGGGKINEKALREMVQGGIVVDAILARTFGVSREAIGQARRRWGI